MYHNLSAKPRRYFGNWAIPTPITVLALLGRRLTMQHCENNAQMIYVSNYKLRILKLHNFDSCTKW